MRVFVAGPLRFAVDELLLTEFKDHHRQQQIGMVAPVVEMFADDVADGVRAEDAALETSLTQKDLAHQGSQFAPPGRTVPSAPTGAASDTPAR